MRFNPTDSGSKSNIRSAIFYGKTLDMFHQLFSDSLMPVSRQHADAIHFDVASRMANCQHFDGSDQPNDCSICLCNKSDVAIVMPHCFIGFGHVFNRRIPDVKDFPPYDSHCCIITLT